MDIILTGSHVLGLVFLPLGGQPADLLHRGPGNVNRPERPLLVSAIHRDARHGPFRTTLRLPQGKKLCIIYLEGEGGFCFLKNTNGCQEWKKALNLS